MSDEESITHLTYINERKFVAAYRDNTWRPELVTSIATIYFESGTPAEWRIILATLVDSVTEVSLDSLTGEIADVLVEFIGKCKKLKKLQIEEVIPTVYEHYSNWRWDHVLDDFALTFYGETVSELVDMDTFRKSVMSTLQLLRTKKLFLHLPWMPDLTTYKFKDLQTLEVFLEDPNEWLPSIQHIYEDAPDLLAITVSTSNKEFSADITNALLRNTLFIIYRKKSMGVWYTYLKPTTIIDSDNAKIATTLWRRRPQVVLKNIRFLDFEGDLTLEPAFLRALTDIISVKFGGKYTSEQAEALLANSSHSLSTLQLKTSPRAFFEAVGENGLPALEVLNLIIGSSYELQLITKVLAMNFGYSYFSFDFQYSPSAEDWDGVAQLFRDMHVKIKVNFEDLLPLAQHLHPLRSPAHMRIELKGYDQSRIKDIEQLMERELYWMMEWKDDDGEEAEAGEFVLEPKPLCVEVLRKIKENGEELTMAEWGPTLTRPLPEQCYDFIEGDQDIEDHLGVGIGQNIVLLDERLLQATCENRDSLWRRLFDVDIQFWSCEAQPNTLAFRPNETQLYVTINTISGRHYVRLDNYIALLQSEGRQFVLLPIMRLDPNDSQKSIHVQLDLTAGVGTMTRGNWVSGHHCQPGTDKKLHEVVRLISTDGWGGIGGGVVGRQAMKGEKIPTTTNAWARFLQEYADNRPQLASVAARQAAIKAWNRLQYQLK